VHEAEKKILIIMNQDLQQELKAFKVIVAYIYKVYSVIRSYYFCHARGLSECKFSGCCCACGMSWRVVVRIED
jgi:hypothetical protein